MIRVVTVAYSTGHRGNQNASPHVIHCSPFTHPVVKQAGYEADHSLLNSAEVKKTPTYASTTSYVFVAEFLFL
jgi:hypothetical protein